MNMIREVLKDATAGVTIVETPQELTVIAKPGCAAAIWQRHPIPGLQPWIDGLESCALPSARLILRPDMVRDAASEACTHAGMPDSAERAQLLADIAALADRFARIMQAPFLRLRLDRVSTNACRRFHVDALTARLICTYRGTGTQYGTSTNGADPARVFTVPTGMPILLRGTLWPEQPSAGLLHRSPPIEGSGETRLLLVLDPIFDPEEDA